MARRTGTLEIDLTTAWREYEEHRGAADAVVLGLHERAACGPANEAEALALWQKYEDHAQAASEAAWRARDLYGAIVKTLSDGVAVDSVGRVQS